jgi:transcription elongation GreA/GreB family factor
VAQPGQIHHLGRAGHRLQAAEAQDDAPAHEGSLAPHSAASVSSPLGSLLVGCHEEDEVEFEAGGVARRVLIVRTERVSAAAA